MADTQINPLGTKNAPADWVLPDASLVTLDAIFAHFDGTGAAGDFVPTLVIVSDSGHTILSVPQDVTVLAGDSADASWAPFLKTAAAAGSSTAPIFYSADNQSTETIASGAFPTWRTLTSFAVSNDPATPIVTLVGGTTFNLRDGEQWIVGCDLLVINTGFAGNAGSVGMRMFGAGAPGVGTVITIPAAYTSAILLSCAIGVISTEAGSISIQVAQDTGVNYQTTAFSTRFWAMDCGAFF